MHLQEYDFACLRAIKETIDKHPANNYSLLSLSEGINEQKLKVGFKQLFGMTVFSYIREQRLEAAKKLLCKTKMDEETIAKKVGFKTVQGFIKAFTKRYKCLPHKFRSE